MPEFSLAGKSALRKIQLGKESNHGVAVQATARLVGKLSPKLTQEYYRPSDLDVGRLSEFDRSVVTGVLADLTYEGDANYEQLAYLLGMAVKGGVTPTASGGAYTWDYTPNLYSTANLDTYTIEHGDDKHQFQSSFCFAKSLELSGQVDDAVMVSANIVGQDMIAKPFTAGLNPPTSITPAISGMGKLYVDTSKASLGTTQFTATLVDWSYKLREGYTPMKYTDGGLTFTDVAEKKRGVDLDVTMAFNDNSYGLFQAYRGTTAAQTPIFVRISFSEPIKGWGLTLEGCFLVAEFDAPDDRDGQSIVSMSLKSIYDPISDWEWGIKLVNGLAVLP